MYPVNFKAKLAQQLRFLKRSCDGYDAGDREEAIRMATAVRIIFHQTKSSTALLTHLDAWDIKIASTIRLPAHTPQDTALQLSPLSVMRVHMQNEIGNPRVDISAEAYGRSEIRGEDAVPAQDWWNQFLLIFPDGRTYSRREFVLDAANKDGGAHVDKKLPELYYSASRKSGNVNIQQDPASGEALFTVQIGLHVDTEAELCGVITDAHFADLRQIAEEVLCSAELVRLAEQTAI